ncbi:MAG: hypothetical protein ABR976_04430 [Terracidiphilus sp.]|jgi:hypothetical protein
MKLFLLRLTGFVAFAVAFLLPAAGLVGHAGGPGSGPMQLTGWMCATIAIGATAGLFHASASAWQGKDAMAMAFLILSGWLNPLTLIYLVFTIWRRLVVIRRILAVAMLICIAATWAFFAETWKTDSPMHPLIGHYLWVAGILIILSPEVFALFKGKPAASV